MKKTQVARILSAMLTVALAAGVLCGANVTPAAAAQENAGIAQSVEIGRPLTDVTEEEVEAFERSLEKELQAADKSGKKKGNLRAAGREKGKGALLGLRCDKRAVRDHAKGRAGAQRRLRHR